jgi:hypothetical protein
MWGQKGAVHQGAGPLVGNGSEPVTNDPAGKRAAGDHGAGGPDKFACRGCGLAASPAKMNFVAQLSPSAAVMMTVAKRAWRHGPARRRW